MKSIGEQLASLLGVSQFARGAWFSLPNEFLFKDGRRWSLKSGRHPVILVISGGPNATVLPRSSSVERGRRHDAHPIRHLSTCCITKNGYISTRSPMRVDARELDDRHFSCYEPDSTGLLEELGIAT